MMNYDNWVVFVENDQLDWYPPIDDVFGIFHLLTVYFVIIFPYLNRF
jgi:hypothetical protein